MSKEDVPDPIKTIKSTHSDCESSDESVDRDIEKQTKVQLEADRKKAELIKASNKKTETKKAETKKGETKKSDSEDKYSSSGSSSRSPSIESASDKGSDHEERKDKSKSKYETKNKQQVEPPKVQQIKANLEGKKKRKNEDDTGFLESPRDHFTVQQKSKKEVKKPKDEESSHDDSSKILSDQEQPRPQDMKGYIPGKKSSRKQNDLAKGAQKESPKIIKHYADEENPVSEVNIKRSKKGSKSVASKADQSKVSKKGQVAISSIKDMNIEEDKSESEQPKPVIQSKDKEYKKFLKQFKDTNEYIYFTKKSNYVVVADKDNREVLMHKDTGKYSFDHLLNSVIFYQQINDL